MNFMKSSIKNVSILKDNTEKRAKEIMAHFGESESELKSVTRCSDILKFEGQLDEDYLKGNNTTLTIEVYVVMKKYTSSSIFDCRKEYYIHWIRNEIKEDGTSPQGIYEPNLGYCNYDRIEDVLKNTSKRFKDFKKGKDEKLDFFGIHFY